MSTFTPWGQLLTQLGPPSGTMAPQKTDTDPGEMFRNAVRNIESYTQQGRQEHPLLAAIGDMLNRLGYTPAPNPKILAQAVPMLPWESGGILGQFPKEFQPYEPMESFPAAGPQTEPWGEISINPSRRFIPNYSEEDIQNLEAKLAGLYGPDMARVAVKAARAYPDDLERLMQVYGKAGAATGGSLQTQPWMTFSDEEMTQLYERARQSIGETQAGNMMKIIQEHPELAAAYMRMHGMR